MQGGLGVHGTTTTTTGTAKIAGSCAG